MENEGELIQKYLKNEAWNQLIAPEREASYKSIINISFIGFKSVV